MTTAKAIESNRNSATKKSGGPRDTSRTRLNSITHGLRSQEVVIPGEDPAQFRAFLDAWVDDWKPTTMARLELVEQCAAAAWRRKRCLRIETARVSKRIRLALNRRAREEKAWLDEAEARLGDDPRGTVAALAGSRAGVDRLIALWQEVARGASGPDAWDDVDAHHFNLLFLHGFFPADDEVIALRDASWGLYQRNAPDDMIDAAAAEPIDDGRASEVAAYIRRLAESRIAGLRALRGELPDPTPLWQAEAEAEAFEPRPEDAPLQRYEAQLSREFHRSLADLTRLTRTGDDLVESPEAVAPSEPDSVSEVITEEKVESESKVREEAPGAGDEEAGSDGSAPATPPEGRRGRRRAVATAPGGPPEGPSGR